MEVIRGSTNSAMAGDSDPPGTQRETEKVGWLENKVDGWDEPGGWPSCLDAGAWAVTWHVIVDGLPFWA